MAKWPMFCICPMCDKEFILEVEDEPNEQFGPVPAVCDDCDAWLEQETAAREREAEDAMERRAEVYYASLAELDANPRYADPFACLGYGFKASEY